MVRRIGAPATLLLLLTGSLVTAGVLQYFGVIKTTLTVKPVLEISKDGSEWLACTGGDYGQCTVTFKNIELLANYSNTVDQTFYIKNNMPVEGTWDYVYFDYEYTMPEDLFDGISSITVHYTTYPSNGNEPTTCDNAEMDFSILQDHKTQICSDGVCTFRRSQLMELTETDAELYDKLGEGMVQKFCGATITLKPNAIPGTYTITQRIVPVVS